MAEESVVGRIQTVLGPIDPQGLGITMTHEHLLIDLSWFYTPTEGASAKEFYEKPVSLETLSQICHYAMRNADDGRLLDIPTAMEEISLYFQHGGNSVIDATSIGIARDPIGLARISRATGVNVIMGSSYYVAASHPPDMARRDEEEIAGQIVRDITEGVDGTGIRSGVIGEVGCSWPLEGSERMVLRASARAQKLTGAPILIHPGRDETAPLEIIEVLAEAGADLSRTIMGHLDRTVFLPDTLMKLAEAGCYLEWDLFGKEESYYWANPSIDMPSDAKRMDDIAWIASEGYGRKVLVAQDICNKHRLETYGGHGYHYILAHIVPRMRARGFAPDVIDDILVNNPKDILTFTSVKD